MVCVIFVMRSPTPRFTERILGCSRPCAPRPADVAGRVAREVLTQSVPDLGFTNNHTSLSGPVFMERDDVTGYRIPKPSGT